MRNAFVAVLTLLTLTRCGSDGEPTIAEQTKPLVGTWQLIQPDSSQAVTLHLAVDPNNPPVDNTPFNVTGRSWVNTYQARLFAAADGKASVDNLSQTAVGGSVRAMQSEQAYLGRLQTVVRYELIDQNQRLRLYYGGAQSGSGLLEYRKAK